MRRLIVTAAAGCTLLAGCSGGNAANTVNTGPFGNGGTPGTECVRLSPGNVLSYGFEEFSNNGTSQAVINKVALADAHGLRVLAAYVVPITGHILYGVLQGYPPARHLDAGVQWAERQKANGARIPPSHGHDVNNLVLVLQPTVKLGSARGIEVFYSEAGQQYDLRTATRVVISVSAPCPSQGG